jgi:hypothetical protein
MVRIAKKSDPKKLADLKKKIEDDTYITHAIQRIAQVLTKEIFDMKEE